MNSSIRSAVALLLVVFSAGAWSHGEQKTAGENRTHASEEKPFGRAGDPRKVSRTVQVDMHDTMRFSASGPGARRSATGAASGEIRISQGETVKFVVANRGKLMHEMVIGTMEELKAHAELMKKHPGMEHDEAYMTHVSPQKKGEIVWQFTRPGEFFYGCLLPGHFEAGMVAKIVVSPAGKTM